MNSTLALVFLVVVVVATAIPIKPDDTPKLMKEGEAFASARLDEFNQVAAADGDLSGFFGDLLKYITKAQKNNEPLLKKIAFIVGRMKAITSGGISRIGSIRLHALMVLVDGNRDNVSYYVLDFSSQWLERRVSSATNTDNVKKMMEETNADIKLARDTLDAGAQKFVQGVKRLRELSANMKGPENELEILAIIHAIDEGTKDTTLVTKTNDAVARIQDLAKN